MTKLDAGLITSLPASDPGSAAVWGSKRINPRPQFCLCLAWSGCPSNDDDDDDDDDQKTATSTLDKINSETEFKARFYNHNHSFNSNSKRNATELSKFIWSCKDSGINPTISWKIICHATPYQHGGKVCNLCLAEKYEILTANDDALLNKRTELINKCRHKNKYKLINAKLKL